MVCQGLAEQAGFEVSVVGVGGMGILGAVNACKGILQPVTLEEGLNLGFAAQRHQDGFNVLVFE